MSSDFDKPKKRLDFVFCVKLAFIKVVFERKDIEVPLTHKDFDLISEIAAANKNKIDPDSIRDDVGKRILEIRRCQKVRRLFREIFNLALEWKTKGVPRVDAVDQGNKLAGFLMARRMN